MKFIHLLILLATSLTALAATPAEKPNTVLIHPGERFYVQFDESGAALKVVSIKKEPNAQAQLVVTMEPFDKEKKLLMFSAESKFKKDLVYKAEMRLLSRNRRADTSMAPVRAGLSTFESWPHPIEELALYGFTLK